MANAKGKDNASTSNSSPKNLDAAGTALNGTTISSPIKANTEDFVIVSESEYDVENLMDEVNAGENAIVGAMNEDNEIEEDTNIENEKNGENETEEERNGDISTEEEKNEEDPMEEENDKEAIEEEMDEDNAKEEQNEKKVEQNAVKKSRKRNRRKKVAHNVSDTGANKEDEDKPESSGKKNGSKKAESMGLIFMCSSTTKKDCYRYKVLGLPSSKREMVEKVYKGMRLFLFDVDLRLLYGIYKAAGPGGSNIEPKAFKSQFPSQVRFTVLDDCLPLAEEKFKKVIKDNYYTRNKFNCQLTSEQVKKLCKLFIASGKGPESKKPRRSRREDTHTFGDQDRTRRLEGRHPTSRDRIRRLEERRPTLRDRTRRLEERRPALRDRTRRLEERHPTLGGELRYHEQLPVMYEREVLTSPGAPMSRVALLPPPAPTPYAAYERMDAYGRDPILEHRDAYRQDALLDHRATYRREPLLEHRDYRVLDLEPRHRDEIRTRDPYPYRDAIYTAALPSEYYPPADLQPDYQSLRPLTDYGSSTGQLPQYHQRRSVYRY